MSVKLYPHQKSVLANTESFENCAYYLDMGLGKTYVGSEKVMSFTTQTILVVCQKSKVDDWVNHFRDVYNFEKVYDLTQRLAIDEFILYATNNIGQRVIGVINYDLIWRRSELLILKDFTLMLDESSLIQNEKAKRSKFILKMKPSHSVLLSGTPVSGKYEQLWSQCRLLGWKISKTDFYNRYVISKKIDINGFPIPIVVGYKNVDELKNKLRNYGAVFMKTEEVITLPKQIEQTIYVDQTVEFRKFRKTGIVAVDNKQLVGDTVLTKILYQRQLCSMFNKHKISAFIDILESTNERLVVFYEFTHEYEILRDIVRKYNRGISVVNGSEKDLSAYDNDDSSVTFIQYRAGAYGLNLQKCRRIVYFTLPLGKGSCDLLEQSKKRIHRIGQTETCFYYYLITKSSIETWNKKLLEKGTELTNELFKNRNYTVKGD